MSLLNLLFFHITTAVPYRIPSEDELNKAYMKTKKMRSILSYIEANYQEKLLLSDVARHEHLSVTYLSHFSLKISVSIFRNISVTYAI